MHTTPFGYDHFVCAFAEERSRNSPHSFIRRKLYCTMSDTEVTYEVRDRIATITFNLPNKLNALNAAQYLRLGKLVEEADKEEDVVATIIQSSGRFYSAGANFRDPSFTGELKVSPHEHFLGSFSGRNVWLTDVFANHSKILIAAINGPVVGLTAALVALCDLIYVKEEKDFFLLAPFSNLGLVAEGAASATFFHRLGWSLASEAVLLARPIPGKDLYRSGFINKTFDGQFKSTEEFNEYIHKMIHSQFENLHEDSIFKNKKLLKANYETAVNAASSTEAIRGFGKWIQGTPQERFAKLAQKDIKHKI